MKRKAEIIKILSSEDRFFSVKEIAKIIAVSSKTIRNELTLIDNMIGDLDITIIKKPGDGIRLKSINNDAIKFIELLDTDFKNQWTPVERQQDILSKLILKDEPLLIKQLSLDYYVSHATINKDIQVINSQISQNNIEIVYKKNEGVQIIGSEEDKRSVLAKITTENSQDEYYIANDVLNSQFLERFKESLNIDFTKVEKIVRDAEHELGFHLSSEALVNLVIHIAIAIRRMQQGNSVTLSDDLIQKLEGQKEYKVAESTAQKIEIEFNVRFSKDETYYILLHFLGAKQLNKKLGIIDFRLESEDNRLEKSVQKMIRNVQVELGIFLENDIHLFNSLILHLKPTISRLEYGLSIQNPLYDVIHRDYGELCQVLLKNVEVFKNDFDVEVPPHEIAYLALHFAAALERNYKPIRTLVMCASGLGTAQLLVAKLERNFANLEIIDVVSNLESNKYTSNEVDLIISTINVSSTLPVIVVSPMLTLKDLEHVRKIVDDTKTQNVFEYLNQDNIHIDKNFKNKNEALNFLNQILIEKEYVNDSYLQGMFYRESIGSTVVAPYIGLPHSETDSVLQSNIQVITLSHPILWDDTNEVKIVLSVNIAKDNTERYIKFIRRLADLAYDVYLWDELLEIKEEKEFVNKFNRMFSEK